MLIPSLVWSYGSEITDVFIQFQTPFDICEVLVFLRGFHRTIVTMAEEYIPGTHSVAFITVPDMEVARKIAQ